MHDFDEKTGVIFFSLIAKSAISCWNSNTRYTPENHAIIAQNDATMNYPVDLQVSDMEGGRFRCRIIKNIFFLPNIIG